jgi:hypothetical protein
LRGGPPVPLSLPLRRFGWLADLGSLVNSCEVGVTGLEPVTSSL